MKSTMRLSALAVVPTTMPVLEVDTAVLKMLVEVAAQVVVKPTVEVDVGPVPVALVEVVWQMWQMQVFERF